MISEHEFEVLDTLRCSTNSPSNSSRGSTASFVSGGEKPPKSGGEPNHGESQTKKGLRNAGPLSWLMAKTTERYKSEWRIVVFWRGVAGRRESPPLFPDEVLERQLVM